MAKGHVAAREPIAIEVEAGKAYWWCSCGQSKNQPFCDGSHKGSEFSPVKWEADSSGTKWFCACKQTGREPFCDGSHKRMKNAFPPEADHRNLREGELTSRKQSRPRRLRTPASGRFAANGEKPMKKLAIAAAVAASLAGANAASAANIVQTAAAAGQFNTLLAAATAAGLAPALSGHTKLTVFAPTDAAFAKLPKGTVESLLKPENKGKLVALLQYHVVPGAIRAADIPVGAAQVHTLKPSGDRSVTTTRFGSAVTVDFARVVKADIHASNGVIHVIDRVLMPTF